MAVKVQLSPEELKTQSTEMATLQSEFEALFSSINSELRSVNSNTTDMIEYRSSDNAVLDFNGSIEVGASNPSEGKVIFLIDERIVKGAGKATLTFTCGGKSASHELTVLLAPEDVYFTESIVHMTLGDTHTLQFEVYPRGADCKEREWYSSDTSVATVDEYGCIHAVGRGTAEISHDASGWFVTGDSSGAGQAYAKCTVVVE